jgi:hypothetical protein
LKKPQLESLGQFLKKSFTDPRRTNRSFPCWSLLVFIAMALFAGRDSLAAIQRYGQFLTQNQRRWLRFPFKKGSTTFRKAPSYTALRNLLLRIDPHQLADCLNGWLQANLGTLPRALAVDGKWIRDRALSLCLSDHETGAPRPWDLPRKRPKRRRPKQRRLQTRRRANHRPEALRHHQPRKRHRHRRRPQQQPTPGPRRSEGWRRLLLPTQKRKPPRSQGGCAKGQSHPPFAHTEEPDTRHGRLRPAPHKGLSFRTLEAGLPGARSLVVIERTSTFDETEEPTLAFYTTSHGPTPGCARRFGETWPAVTGAAAKAATTGCATPACAKTRPAPKTPGDFGFGRQLASPNMGLLKKPSTSLSSRAARE